jgi:hypothetical protein
MINCYLPLGFVWTGGDRPGLGLNGPRGLQSGGEGKEWRARQLLARQNASMPKWLIYIFFIFRRFCCPNVCRVWTEYNSIIICALSRTWFSVTHFFFFHANLLQRNSQFSYGWFSNTTWTRWRRMYQPNPRRGQVTRGQLFQIAERGFFLYFGFLIKFKKKSNHFFKSNPF